MKHLKKAGILLALGILIIFVRNYEAKQNIEIAQESMQNAKLVRVVDGDTLVVTLDGQQEKIRIIGINTPESVKPNSPVECFGKEASFHIEELLDMDGLLSVQTDPTQDTYDRNGRLLAHVFIGEVNIAREMLFDGYAYEYTYRKPYIYQSEYRDAQRQAQENKRGLWSPDTCNGQK